MHVGISSTSTFFGGGGGGGGDIQEGSKYALEAPNPWLTQIQPLTTLED